MTTLEMQTLKVAERAKIERVVARHAATWVHECDNCGTEHTFADDKTGHTPDCGPDACAYCDWLTNGSQT